MVAHHRLISGRTDKFALASSQFAAPTAMIDTRIMLVEVVPEAGGWSIFIPGMPIAADGDTLDAAMTEMVDALREYASDWHSHLRDSPNHRGHEDLVQLIDQNDDDQLRDWLLGD